MQYGLTHRLNSCEEAKSALVRAFWKPCCCIQSSTGGVWEWFSVLFMILLVSSCMGCPGCMQQGLNAVGHVMVCIQGGQHLCGVAAWDGQIPTLCTWWPTWSPRVCGFMIPLCLLCPGVGWRAVCPYVQFRATSMAEHSGGRTLGHCRWPRPCTAAQQSCTWYLRKANAVWSCIAQWCTAQESLFFLSVLFFPSGF